MKPTGFERRTFAAIAEAVVPVRPEDGLGPAPSQMPLESFLLTLYRDGHGRAILGLRAAIVLVGLLPLLLFRFRTFAGLSLEARSSLLTSMSHSSIYIVRELPMLLKTMVLMGWGALAEVQRAVGITRVDSVAPDWVRDAGGSR